MHNNEGHKYTQTHLLSFIKNPKALRQNFNPFLRPDNSIKATILVITQGRQESSDLEETGLVLCQNDTFFSSIMKVNKKCDNLHFMYFRTSCSLRYAEIRSSHRRRLRPREIKGIASPVLCLEL